MAEKQSVPMTPIGRLRSHPVYQPLLERYRAAREAWWEVRESAEVIGLTMEEYCDSYVQSHFPLLAWSSDTANEVADFSLVSEQAWLDSMPS
jgi:hypothetical protein